MRRFLSDIFLRRLIKIILPREISPTPPIWIRTRMMILPINVHCVAVTTVTSPVTQTLVVAVNMASVKEVWYPGAVQNGSHRSNPPKIITPAKPRVII
jgi:hypothetical protein